MYSEFKLLRSDSGGCLHFARVGVNAEPSDDDRIELSDAIHGSNPKTGEASREQFPEWISAAMEGSRDCLSFLQATKVIVGGKATIIKVIGAPIDTDEPTVRCAAALATWKAITSAPLPRIAFENGHWCVKWGET